MAKIIELTGQRFGRLIVLNFIGRVGQPARGGSHRVYQCRCDCGNYISVKTVALRHKWTQSCGCLRKELLKKRMTGSNNPGWVGGKRTSKEGYIDVWMPQSQTYRREHDVIVEQHLGRKLLPKETVHHKNGVKSDNTFSNLELWSSNHPSGQRIEDKIQWCVEFLGQYAPHLLNG